MKKKSIPSNNITKLRHKRGMSIHELAKEIGISAGQLSRLENGKSGLKAKWLLKFAAMFEVTTNEIVSLPFSKKFNATSDDVLVGEAIGWLLEASEELDVELSRHQLSKLTSFIYKEYVERPLDLQDRKHLAYTAIRVFKIGTEE